MQECAGHRADYLFGSRALRVGKGARTEVLITANISQNTVQLLSEITEPAARSAAAFVYRTGSAPQRFRGEDCHGLGWIARQGSQAPTLRPLPGHQRRHAA